MSVCVCVSVCVGGWVLVLGKALGRAWRGVITGTLNHTKRALPVP